MFSHRSHWPGLSALLFLGATVLPFALQGQQSSAADRGVTSAQETTGETSIMVPMAAPASLIAPYLALPDPLLVPFGITNPVPASPLALIQAQNEEGGLNIGSDLALMTVGGAALLIGLVIGDDAGTIIAVGGGVVAIIGLYRWLR